MRKVSFNHDTCRFSSIFRKQMPHHGEPAKSTYPRSQHLRGGPCRVRSSRLSPAKWWIPGRPELHAALFQISIPTSLVKAPRSQQNAIAGRTMLQLLPLSSHRYPPAALILPSSSLDWAVVSLQLCCPPELCNTAPQLLLDRLFRQASADMHLLVLAIPGPWSLRQEAVELPSSPQA